MKNFLRIGLILVTLLITYFASAAYFKAFTNSVKLTDVTLKKGNSTAINLRCSQSTLTSAFGNPTQVSNYSFESLNKTGYLVTYGGNNFYFIDDKLIGFEITTTDFTITFGNPAIPTGVGTAFDDTPPGFTVKNNGTQHAEVYDLKNADGTTTDQFLEYDYLSTGSYLINEVIYGDY